MRVVETVVAILNRNHGPQLRLCLDSLLSQNPDDAVVIVVDGNSTDDSLQTIEEYSRKDKRVQLLIQKSRGTGKARNELIEHVQTCFPEAKRIVWGDSENLYHEDYLNAIRSVDADVVGGVNIIDSDSPLSQALWWAYNGLTGKTVVGNNESVRASLYGNHRYPPITRTEDFFFCRQLREDGARFSKTYDAICYIKTAESLREFVQWERSRTQGLLEGARITGRLMALLATYVGVVSAILLYFVIAPFIFSLSLLLGFLYIAIFLGISAFMWIHGRRYLRRPRKLTALFIFPVFILDPFAVLLFLARATLPKHA